VSSVDLPLEVDSLPLRIVGLEPLGTERQVAQLVVDQPSLQLLYAGWMAALHPTAWKEAEEMARTANKRVLFDIRPAIEMLGLKQVIEQVGAKRVIEEMGAERVIEEMGAERVIEEMGAERVIEEVGIERIVELAGKKVVKYLGLDGLLANLSPAERRELKRRLE
jgi:hypothetical protein